MNYERGEMIFFDGERITELVPELFK